MLVNDYLRSFGMSGLMITEDLKAIEQKHDIELGHVSRAAQQSATEYYPQFEQEVRREAAVMAQHYELFYCLEQAIRKIITETLEEAEGANWWDAKVVQKIRDDVKELQKRRSTTASPVDPSAQSTTQRSASFRSSSILIGRCLPLSSKASEQLRRL
jgi:hypothetical protein